MTQKAHLFMEANKQSPVVYGSMLDAQRGGTCYRLADGRTFRLTRGDCRIIGQPRWAGHE